MSMISQTRDAHSLKNTQDASGINISRKLRRVEAYLDVGLRSQVINFVRPYRADDFNERAGVTQIAVMQMELRMAFKVGYPFPIIH